MSNNAMQQLYTGTFGDLHVANLTPITQISTEYGLLNKVNVTVDEGGSGSTSVQNTKFRCSTGTSPTGLSAINSLRQAKYRAGQGLVARFSAVFTQGVPNSRQAAGLITAENSMVFGYINDQFGIAWAKGGEPEVQELTLTSSGSGNVDITINGTVYTVTLTAGTTQHNALEIADSLSTQVPNHTFASNGSTVVCRGDLPFPEGAYAYDPLASGSAASWVQKKAATAPDITFIPQSQWNGTKVDWLDPAKGNVYAIEYKHLGFGNPAFYVEHQDTGELIRVHTLRVVNTTTDVHSTNPTFRVGWLAQNLGNTTDLVVEGGSAAVFVEGDVRRDTSPRAAVHDQVGVSTTTTNIIAIRNRVVFNDKINRSGIFPILIAAATQANKSAFFELVTNPTFNGDVTWQYVDQNTSIVEVATDNVTVSGGVVVGAITVSSGSSIVVRLNESPRFDTVLGVGDVFAVVARTSGGQAADMQASITWQEDL